ncbi:hypothetical protein [Picosynechococcus sp. NKBG15041c]|uniref:hypothetical protein n=1 Tax=Picosynechococcus sp. NKBG15041c TaxID=1407650 RepID=UPI00191C353C|nr:hypothetical protein [Picosynechococcus sp. NKBG15041c]
MVVGSMAIAFKASRWFLSSLIAVNLIGCNPWTVLSQEEDQTISALQTLEPGVEVQVEGIVRQRVPLLNQGAYELEDSTGRIWVITTAEALPTEGTSRRVSGRLEFHDVQLQQQNFGEFFIQEADNADFVEQGEISTPQIPIKEHLDFQFLPHKAQQKS